MRDKKLIFVEGGPEGSRDAFKVVVPKPIESTEKASGNRKRVPFGCGH